MSPITKRDLIRYLAAVSPYMLPHLKDRPLTMIRMPEGIHGERFFQKHWEQSAPDFVIAPAADDALLVHLTEPASLVIAEEDAKGTAAWLFGSIRRHPGGTLRRRAATNVRTACRRRTRDHGLEGPFALRAR